MISMIWAMDRNRAIGIENRIPWRLPADMAFFKAYTTGKTVVMGRKTFESFPKALPNRRNVVLTRSAGLELEGAETVTSIEEALKRFENEKELVIIGGSEIYSQFIPYADQLLVTEIDGVFADTDAFFPALDWNDWELIESREGVRDEKNTYDYRFLTYKRL
ncbi:Dihydrofolate reductase [Paenibacillus curdlanolyticus YK9]|uniref:Dihydrofolate reductase n=1 Tax=Paenibacillus curdlanolyticus YK9 TaxID=717606 RepID=E0I570_9BACL|nr:dihydrofolate reductase [Paenibacillus curdlanolyticus]EFM12112.1 Dihydrofolate reductase [Paenibacillus curdlanolyticus YK9]